ncbi:MAG: mechanosensitive ion channel protein MscS [Spirochaetes bacterium]|nr:MAG: mechanosensitive ion channel protein MscS [Spirochaetota bacterium]
MKQWLSSPLSVGNITLPFSLLDFLLRFALPAAGFFLGAFLLSLLIRRLTKRYVKEEKRQRRILLWTRRILRTVVFIGIMLSIVSLMGARAYGGLGHFFSILNKPFFTSGKTQISVITLLLFIPVIAVASWTGKLVSASLESRSLNRFGLDAEQSFSLGRLLRYAAMVLVFIFGMSIIGIDLSAVGVLFGVLGIGIGFGLQSIIADFFAGITLISMGLVKEGDRIRVGEYDGNIRHIRLMNTELITFENETLIIPNRQLTGGTIHNYSYKDRRVVIVNEVDVSYNSDLDEVIELLKAVASRNPWLQSNSEILVRVKTFASSGISMQLRTWIHDVGTRADAMSWTNLEIWRTFAAHNIEIPFSQIVVHQQDSSSIDLLRPEVSVSAAAEKHIPDTTEIGEE